MALRAKVPQSITSHPEESAQQRNTISDYRCHPDDPKATEDLGVHGTTKIRQVRGLSGLHEQHYPGTGIFAEDY